MNRPITSIYLSTNMCQELIQKQSGSIIQQPTDIISSTLTHFQKQRVSNSIFGEAIFDQVQLLQVNAVILYLEKNYHTKVLRDDRGLNLTNSHTFVQSRKEKYDTLAQRLIASCLIVKNSTSSLAHTYLKEQYYVNQTNYPDRVIMTVAFITSFGENSTRTGGGGGSKDTERPNAIVALYLVDDSNNNSDYDDEPVESFESNDLNDGRTSNDAVSIADTPSITCQLKNDIIYDFAVVTNDGDCNNKDDNNDNKYQSENNDDGSSEDDSGSDDITASSTTTPKEGDSTTLWIAIVAIANNNVKNAIDSDIFDHSQNNWFYLKSNFDFNAEGVYDNDDTDDIFVCMKCTEDPYDKQYNNNNVHLHLGVLSDADVISSVYPNFFNDTINDSRGRPYTNTNPITDTQILHHSLLRSLVRIKRANLDNSTKDYDAFRCKFRQIGIYNSVNYLRIDSHETLNSLLSNSDLPLMQPLIIDYINYEIIFPAN